jgi:hypothetical protein
MVATDSRTYNAVETFLTWVGLELYEVGALERASERMLLRRYDRDGLLKAVDWMRAMNSQGRDLYIRPALPDGLVLVDDLTPTNLHRLLADDPTCRVVVETSPSNFQAWVWHLDYQPRMHTLNAFAADLARRYGADTNAANWRQFGRLPGFTNRKPSYRRDDGLYPYVLLHDGYAVARTQQFLHKTPMGP